MSKHQEHFGRKFYLDKTTGYWISTTYPRIRAHQWVWINSHGKQPKGYHVHHKNEDKSDNIIENLELLSEVQHYHLHLNKHPERRERFKALAEEIRPLTKAWHASDEGHQWHKAHGILTWIDRKPIEIQCLVCGKKVVTKTYHQKFCHQNCKAKHMRKRKKDERFL